ncbi:MAG TPA: glycosyltransferase family 9 protein [Bacteroidales bacterium]|nr:glycosyltransferase family 9 protein [Bacteroidales bacterium]
MRLLVIRTSAMGDVAFTTPVINGIRKQYPEVELVFLTRAEFRPFFSEDEGLKLFFPDLKGRHKGLIGIFRLFHDLLKSGTFDHVIDLHAVMRSLILGFLFRLRGVKVSVIDKGRKEKRDIINGRIKIQLKHSAERYSDVFARAGFPVNASDGPWIRPSQDALKKTAALIESEDLINIGVAPYAKHGLKRWPEEHMKQLLGLISENHKVKFWLFGGNEELVKLEALASSIKDSYSVAGKLKLEEELALMSRLRLMIAMDSSNMHMAALVGTPVISIWGGTDPLTGFGAWQQPDEYSLRIPVDELSCRPCTVFGKGRCKRGDFACMMWLTPEKVYDTIVELKLIPEEQPPLRPPVGGPEHPL